MEEKEREGRPKKPERTQILALQGGTRRGKSLQNEMEAKKIRVKISQVQRQKIKNTLRRNPYRKKIKTLSKSKIKLEKDADRKTLNREVVLLLH